MWENETGADAAPAVQMGNEIVGCFYLLGPSIHRGQPAGLPSILQQQQGKRKQQFTFLGKVSHLKPRWRFPQGNCTASLDMDDLIAEVYQGQKRADLSWSTCSTMV